MGYRLARELAEKTSYTGKGTGRSIRKRDLTEEEKQSWDWKMIRCVGRGNQDYLGREEEINDFEGVGRFLEGIITTTI